MRTSRSSLVLVLLGLAASLPCVSSETPAGADPDWISAVRADIRDSEYRVTWQAETRIPGLGPSWHASNRAQGFRTYFTDRGIRVVSRVEAGPPWEWGLALFGYGRGEATWPVAAASASSSSNRVDYSRGSLGEWYVNSPRGLEQGFTLEAPPEEMAVASGASSADLDPLLHLDLELLGDLLPVVSRDGRAIDFRDAHGANVIRFSELVVTDASGRELPSWMEGLAEPGLRGIRIVLDATDAVYPITVDPLASSPSWTAEPDQASASFGFTVLTAGDVNGDGYSDVIVGAPNYDNGQTDEGGAFVYHGSAAGLGATAAWTAEGNQASAYFGRFVSTAGDVNGDGYSDVIVGAPFYDNGQMDEGSAYVYLGSSAGLGSSAAWTAEGDQAEAYFGYAVSTAGDVNGDGYSDIIVSADEYDNGQTDEGRVYVYRGSASGLVGGPWTAEGNQTLALFGRSVSTAGDVNGDGYADIVVGAYGYDGAASDGGRAFVYHGSASGLGAAAAWTAESSQATAYFGYSVSTAGDLNGDGFADVVIGALSFDNGETDEGGAFAYFGSASGLRATADWTAEGDQASANFGCSVSTAGDVDGDGYSDVVVGARNYDNVEGNEGRAYLYRGSPTGLAASAMWSAEGDQADGYFGFRVAIAGDVNGDGYDDVLVGAYDYDAGFTDNGRVYLFLGSSTGPASAPAWTADGPGDYDVLGFRIAGAGDVNGDGFADVLAGGDSTSLVVFLYHGSASGLSAAPDWTSSSYGGAAAGDINGDGYGDVILTSSGNVRVYYGSSSGLTGRFTQIDSPQSGSGFGISYAGAGDVNGDGLSEVIVGANVADNGQTDEGRAFLFLGSAVGIGTSPAWTAEGDQASAHFGYSVDMAGDVNGDGYSDVIVGAPEFDNGQTDEGRTFLFLGSASGLAPAASWTAEGDQAFASFGISVSTAGDANGDGYSDVVVGAYYYDNDQSNEGRVLVYNGSSAGLGSTPAWSVEGNQASAILGSSVAGGGDLDGDGFSDIVAGAGFFDGAVTNGGLALAFAGNGGAGLAALPRQRRGDDTAPIAPLGFFESTETFRIAATGRSPFGRGRVRLEWEVEPLGSAFDGVGTSVGSTWSDSGTAGAALSEQASPPSGDPGVLLWRARVRYDPATTPLQPFGRWLTPVSSGPREADLQALARADVRIVSHTDSPDPDRLDDPITYTITVENLGPGVPTSVVVKETLSPSWAISGVHSVSASQGTCSAPANPAVCDLGPLAVGAQAAMTIVVYPDDATTLSATAETTGAHVIELDPANNTSVASTTILPNHIGDRVWEDRDGDGIQDPGEPGIVGALVYLFSNTWAFEDVTFTDVNGRYGFDVALASHHYLRFIPPTGYVISPRNVGTDDLLDSDSDPATGNSPLISWPRGVLDATRWDAGMVPPCYPPDEPVYIASVRKDSNNWAILDFQDPNQPNQVTGYNVYRSSNPAAPWPWPMVGSNVRDMDEATPNLQWVDQSGDPGTWYYEVNAYSSVCDAEGPR